VAHIRKRLPVHGVGRESRQQFTGPWAGDEDRPEHRGLIDDVGPKVPEVGPVPQPCLHRVRASGRRRDEVTPSVEGAHEPVVHDVAGLVEGQHVARTARPKVADATRIDAVDERGCIRPGNEELPERADVHETDPFANGPVFVGRVAVVVGPLPGSGPVQMRIEVHVNPMQRRPLLDDLVNAARQVLEADGTDGGPRGRTSTGRR
jgi:hypothetical protein